MLHRANEAHGEQHQVGLHFEFEPGISALPASCRLPFDAGCDQLFDLAVPAVEALGGDRPVALTALLVRGRSAQPLRPVRPYRVLVRLGRHRQQLELGDRFGAVAVRRADAVGSGVATADHDDVLAGRPICSAHPGRRQRRRFCSGRNSIAKWTAVELAARHRQVARLLQLRRRGRQRRTRRRSPHRAISQRHSRRPTGARPTAWLVLNSTPSRAIAESAVEQPPLHLEVGNAVAQKSADAIVLLESYDA